MLGIIETAFTEVGLDNVIVITYLILAAIVIYAISGIYGFFKYRE